MSTLQSYSASLESEYEGATGCHSYIGDAYDAELPIEGDSKNVYVVTYQNGVEVSRVIRGKKAYWWQSK